MSGATHRGADRPLVYVWPAARGGSALDLSDDVLAFQTSKTIKAPAGTFSLTVAPRARRGDSTAHLRERELAWRVVEEGGIVSIGMDRPGGIMVGVIERIGHTRVAVGGEVRRALSITGRDLGALLDRDQIQHAFVTVDRFGPFYAKIQAALGEKHPMARAFQGTWGPVAYVDPEGKDFRSFIGATLQEVADWILSEVTSFQIPAFSAFGGSGRAGDVFETRITEGFNGQFWSESPNQFSGTVFGFLRGLIDADFYELWVDSVPTESAMPQPVLVIRPKPFDDPLLNFLPVESSNGVDWQRLRTMVDNKPHHAIPEADVFEEDLGRSSAEALSFYLVRSNNALLGNPANESEGLFFPAVDTWAASRYGMQAYRADLNLIAQDLFKKSQADADYTGDVVAEVRDARNRLVNWYRLNPFFETGQIRVVGHDKYRVGDKVYLEHVQAARTAWDWATWAPLEQEGLEFYASTVAQSWTFGGHYTTSLGLERGYNRQTVEHAKKVIADAAPASNPSHLAET